MLVFVGVVRPFRRAAGALNDEALVRRAVQEGLGFGVVSSSPSAAASSPRSSADGRCAARRSAP